MEVSAKEESNARLRAAGACAEAKYRATLDDIASLASDIQGLKGTIESLKHEVAESRARLHAQGDRERALRSQLESARRELHALRARPEVPEYSYDAQADLGKNESELAAEVRSLRAVLDLKQAEATALRGAHGSLAGERERRACAERELRAALQAGEELRERAAARQRDAERLRDDNLRLREAAARDRDHAARMQALSEELRYKLRQKSQVVSLLAGGGYLERVARARSASGDSGRSPSPPPSPPSPPTSPAPAPADGSPAIPAVKGVVEKHDSVSWVLEIEESPEEVASRLARRSSFRAPASPASPASPGGVKRRGGGSPGAGSPAPTSPAPNASKLFRPGELDFPPPPLKESAGEAIYIYDDRQY